MPHAESPESDATPGPPKPPPRIPDGQPNPFYAAHRGQLAQLREEFAIAVRGDRAVLVEEVEWQALPQLLRFLVLTAAGLDDPDDALRRRWREFTDAERVSIRATLRTWLRVLRALGTLTL